MIETNQIQVNSLSDKSSEVRSKVWSPPTRSPPSRASPKVKPDLRASEGFRGIQLRESRPGRSLLEHVVVVKVEEEVLPPRSECLGFPPRHVCAAERCLLLTYLLKKKKYYKEGNKEGPKGFPSNRAGLGYWASTRAALGPCTALHLSCHVCGRNRPYSSCGALRSIFTPHCDRFSPAAPPADSHVLRTAVDTFPRRRKRFPSLCGSQTPRRGTAVRLRVPPHCDHAHL